MILIKKDQSYSYSCESSLHLLLALSCITHLYLFYSLLVYSFNLFLFLIRSKINHLIDCCLSLYFLRILSFAIRLLQHGDIELIHGLKYFSNFHWKLNSLTAHNYL